jgi:hypothetical protein
VSHWFCPGRSTPACARELTAPVSRQADQGDARGGDGRDARTGTSRLDGVTDRIRSRDKPISCSHQLHTSPEAISLLAACALVALMTRLFRVLFTRRFDVDTDH